LGEFLKIGRIFAYWAIVYFEHYFWATYFLHGKKCVFILTEKDWATFWALFSQTHLVTLDKGLASADAFQLFPTF
jgi:hypothetical protein